MSILLIAAHTPAAGKTAIAAGLATLAAGFDAGSGPTPVAVCNPCRPPATATRTPPISPANSTATYP